jgi:hypothetical protein
MCDIFWSSNNEAVTINRLWRGRDQTHAIINGTRFNTAKETLRKSLLYNASE